MTMDFIQLDRADIPASRSGVCDPTALQQIDNFMGIEYLTTIKIDGSPVTVVVDTGSSDTWAIEKDYQCYTWVDTQAPQSSCNFSAGVQTDFKPGNKLDSLALDIRYGDRTWAKGSFGFAQVDIAGITVPKQQVSSLPSFMYHVPTFGGRLLSPMRRTGMETKKPVVWLD
jgi:hypothetical protein